MGNWASLIEVRFQRFMVFLTLKLVHKSCKIELSVSLLKYHYFQDEKRVLKNRFG